jgi:FlaA1/EpsC-like NDP-sugar epimerase
VLAYDGDAQILGFIDDDPRKAGIRVMGYPVLGGGSALGVLAKAGAVDRIVICVRQMPPERLNNLEVLCAENNITLLRLKVGLETVIDGDTPRSESGRSQVSS